MSLIHTGYAHKRTLFIHVKPQLAALCKQPHSQFGRIFPLQCEAAINHQALQTYQKLCPHLVMCASSIISKQMGLRKVNREGEKEGESHDLSSCVRHGCCAEGKLTRQNRCFYPHTNSRDRCKGASDAGISFGCPRMQKVCTERRNRPGTTARRPNWAPTSLPRWPLSRSVRAQDSRSCSRYQGQHCSHRRRRRSSCPCFQPHCRRYYYCCCCCLC